MSIYTNPASGAKEDANAYIRAILDLVEEKDPIKILEELPNAITEIVQGLSGEELKMPEAPGKWSIAEIIQHLADSELVWAYRLRMIIAHDNPEITGFNQDLWAKKLKYKDAEINLALCQLHILRETNLNLIRGLPSNELKRIGIHNERGAETLEHMIKLYAGHDLVHRNQLKRIKTKLGSTNNI